METGAAAEASPDLDEVLQEEPAHLTAVPVTVLGPVQSHDLPARRAQLKADVVAAGSWTHLCPETLKRKQVLLISTDKAFYVSTDGTGSTGFLWPANVPLVMTHTQKIYVMSADPAGSTISHCSELWAD